MENKFSLTTDRSDMFYWQSDRPFNGKETKEIFLDRHQRFNPEITKQAISYGMQQYGKSKADAQVVELDKPIASGSVNLVSKAVLSDGTKVIIRAHPSNIPNGYFWVEKIATEKAISFDVPVYKTYYVYDQKKEFDFDFMLIEQLPGKNIHKEMWPLEKDVDHKITEQTGYYAAKINSIKTSKFGFFDNKIAKEKGELVGIHKAWRDHLYAALNKNLQYLTNKKVISNTQRSQIENIFTSHENVMICKNPSLIHNDIADWNQVAVKDKVTGMLDWDECFSGDPIMEFAAYSLFFDEPRLTWFKEGYETISKLGDDFEEKFHLYKLRYIVSKLHLRKVKLEDTYSDFLQDKLEFGLKCLNDELKWYGKNN